MPAKRIAPTAAPVETDQTRQPRLPAESILAGIGLMLLGIFLFAANDALGKWLMGTFSVGQLLLVRSAASLIVMGPFLVRGGLAAFRSAPRPFLQIARMVLATAEVAFFYAAVASLPLADTMTYYLASPIYVAALSPWLLRERTGWRQWLAVLAGFAGVLIVLRPSAGAVSPGALLALAGGVCFALLMILSRTLATTPTAVLVTNQTLGALLFGAVAAPFQWVPVGPPDLALLGLLGVVSMLGHLCITQALKLAPAGVVVPFQYTMILWGIVLGYAVFGDVPEPAMLVGSATVVAAGLFVLPRRRKP